MNIKLEYFATRSKPFIFLTALTVIAIIGILDYVTGSDISISVFYVLPIMLVTWFLGKRYGYILSLISAMVWFQADYAWRSGHIETHIIVWNAFVRFCFFIIITVLLNYLRSFIDFKTEIAKRSSLEEGIKQSERRYKDLLENIGEGYFVLDSELKLTYCSPSIYLKTGYNEKDLIGNSVLKFIHPKDHRLLAEHYSEALKKYSDDTIVDCDMITRAGGVLNIEVLIRIIRDESGSVIEYRNIARDVSERKKIEAELRLSAMRFHQVTENIEEVFWIVDAVSNKILYVSPAYELIWGRTPQGLYDQPSTWIDAVHPDDRERVREKVSNIKVEGRYDAEYRIIRPNGETRWIRNRASAVKNERDEIFRIVGIADDITERKNAETVLSNAESRFREFVMQYSDKYTDSSTVDTSVETDVTDLASRIKNVLKLMEENLQHMLFFSAIVAHELRTPLTILRHEIESVLNADTSKDVLRKSMVSVYEELFRLNRTVDMFLNIARIQTHTFKLEVKKTDFKLYLNKFCSEAEILGKAHEISIQNIDSPIAFVDIDEAYFKQVLFNLLDNALRHTFRGGFIKFGYIIENGEVNFKVEDNGEGIPPDVLPSIFNPFTTHKRGESISKGIGMGLTLVKMIVEKHGGRIEVQSKVKKGTTFHLFIPLSRY